MCAYKRNILYKCVVFVFVCGNGNLRSTAGAGHYLLVP